MHLGCEISKAWLICFGIWKILSPRNYEGTEVRNSLANRGQMDRRNSLSQFHLESKAALVKTGNLTLDYEKRIFGRAVLLVIDPP